MAKITKEKLAERGVYAQVSHLRLEPCVDALYPKSKFQKLGLTPSPTGGRTIAKLRDKENDTLLAVGIAECSRKDQFCKRVGWQIAVGRAFATLDEPTD